MSALVIRLDGAGAEAFKAENESIAARIIDGFPMINRDFSDDWVLNIKVAKDCLAQHVCTPGMFATR